MLTDTRRGKNGRHGLVGQFRQSVFGRLGGDDDVDDADRLGLDPVMRWIVGGHAVTKQAASSSRMGRFETEVWRSARLREGDNAVRLRLHALTYNLANFMRTLALPKEVEHWSLTTLREKPVKIGAKVVRHGRYVTFQLAEVAVSGDLFRKILSLIDDLRRRPVPA